ncbi:Molybdenum ABC transporter, periplasmic molybdenum-binding protein ModA (TC 3.A.1.8.1) [hydrothermal vent metagenome]|uniref:Molybdenum ABC transporter, periplasmic molybdenum-binding protein ModA (TC 3.A.1.8.1) n=1 Tax=hydrothermal vent metagenome TaxID=652676 RepID=A0A1W1EEN4_9ZZZZ
MRFILFFMLFASSFSFAANIQVAVAANVSYAIDELVQEFNVEHPDTKVRVILGSSGKLTAQISHGAPYDLFMSANMKYPEALYEKNLSNTKPVVYAEGTLALFSVKKHDFRKGLELLKDVNVKKIAVANPKTAPYGIAAEEALKNANIYDAVKSKFIYGESVSQTVSYAVTAADMGIIATSSLYSKHMTQYKKNLNWIELDSSLYTPIKQGIILLKRSKSMSDAKAFYDFMLSKKAKNILEKYGYKEP